jgi:hypothetical protein
VQTLPFLTPQFPQHSPSLSPIRLVFRWQPPLSLSPRRRCPCSPCLPASMGLHTISLRRRLKMTFQMVGNPPAVSIQYSFISLVNMPQILTAHTHRQLIRRLNAAGFIQSWYGDYRNPCTLPTATWTTILSLCQIDPPGKFQSTVRDLKMYLIKHIVTQDIQLEGVYSQALIGPTPRNLVDPDVAATTTANRME